jgi:hypothetical protein
MAQGLPPTIESLHASATASGDTPSDPHAARQLQELHRRLETFIGRWNVAGRNSDAAPVAPNSPIRGENHFEWLPGQFFVIGRFRHDNALGAHSGASLMGVEEHGGALFAHNFDNLGYERRYAVSCEDGVWRFVGQFERATLVFGQDGRSYEERWELSKDGASFTALCELHATKLGAHA